jgi:hypothetical protein
MLPGITPIVAGRARKWTRVVDVPFTTNANSFAGYTNRQIIPASEYLASGGSKIQVTLVAATSGAALRINNVYIGHGAATGNTYNFESTPTPMLTADGLSDVSVAANQSAIFEAPFTINPTKRLIISCYCPTGSGNTQRVVGSKTGWLSTSKTGIDAATVAATGYTSEANYAYFWKTIDVLV